MSRSIVIIGAGYTGLVAALRLAESGYKVSVLERGNVVGGLASDFKVEGASLERAYHHLFKTDTHIINLVNELGLEDKLKWHNSSLAIYYEHQLYPFTTPIDLLRFRPLSFPNRIRAGAVAYYLQKTKRWQQFKSVSAYDWMLRFSGKQVCKVIWEPLLKGKFDKYYRDISMAWLWARIHIRANSKERGDTTEKLGYFDGGFQVFTDALVEALKNNGVEIKTGVEIKSITLKSNKPIVKFANGKVNTYDSCIATVPSHVFAHLIKGNKQISKSYLDQLDSIEYLGARLLIFSSEQDLSKYYWHNINDIKLPFLVFINHTKLVGKKAYNNKNVYYIGAYLPHDHELFNCPDKKLEKLWFAGIKEIFPDFKIKLIREKHFFRFANAQHIVNLGYDKKIPSYQTPLSNVYLSNFSQIYPEDRGTNYAVREGEKIAEIIKESFK